MTQPPNWAAGTSRCCARHLRTSNAPITRGLVRRDGHRLRCRDWFFASLDDAIDHTESLRFLRRHVSVAIELALDALERLMREFAEDLEHPTAKIHDLSRGDLDVRRRPLGPGRPRLMHHYSRMRQR